MKKIIFILFSITTFLFSALPVKFYGSSYYTRIGTIPANLCFSKGTQVSSGVNNTMTCASVSGQHWLTLSSPPDNGWYYQYPYLQYDYCSSNGHLAYILYNTSQVANSLCVTPTCSANQHLDPTTNKCVANPGYHMDGNVSKPDVTCPPSMKYKYVASPWYQFDIKTCVPDSNISQSQCESNPNNIYLHLTEHLDSASSVGALTYGVGCANIAYLQNKAWFQNLSFAVSGLLPSASISPSTFSFIPKLFNWGVNKTKYIGKNLWSAIVSKFKGTNNTFFDTQPGIIDMSVGSDGVYYDVSLTPKTPTPPTSGWKSVYDNYIKNGWSFPTKSGDLSPDVPDLKLNDVTFPTGNNDFYYSGSDSSMTDSSIIVANSIKNKVTPNLSAHLSAVPLQTFQTSVSVKPDFLGNLPSVSYPADFALISNVDMGGGVFDKTFKGTVTLPDGSKVNYRIKKTVNPNGSSVDDVVVSHTVSTKNGVKVFSNNYSNVVNSSGTVTSSVSNPSTVSFTDATGHVVNAPNGADSYISATPANSAIDLSFTNNKLSNIDKSLNDLNTKVNDFINTRPADATNAEASLNNFKSASDLFDVIYLM